VGEQEDVMTRIHGKLSALAVKNTTERGLYADGGGLYLQVARNGSKSWILRYRLGGRRRYCGLGSLLRVTLAEARQRAGEARSVLMAGNDPIAIKEGQRTATRLNAARSMTFAKAAAQYIESHRAGWSPKSVSQWAGTLKQHVNPVIGALPVQDIDTALVMKTVEPIWSTKTETASRVRGRIESILDWAATRGFRTGDNPARWSGHLENLLPAPAKVAKVEHHAAMPYATVPAFMVQLRRDPTSAARALEFAILTAARTAEILTADWSEIDLDAKVWAISASRMKAGRDHKVPLSDAAVELLSALPGPRAGIVFPGSRSGRPMNQMQLRRQLRGMGQTDATVHGFRSAFVDWSHEQTVFAREVIEMSLAHSVGSAVEKSYRRTDLFARRRALMSAWADFCAGKAQPSATVTELRRA
jgi:integrase